MSNEDALAEVAKILSHLKAAEKEVESEEVDDPFYEIGELSSRAVDRLLDDIARHDC